jgi:tetratricopeptide (TPR) repeat protein
VSAVLERTAARLSDKARDILVVAALIGRDFLASDLIGVGLFEIDEIDDALEEGRKHNLCAPSDPTASQDHMTFVHSAVHTFFEGGLEARMDDIHRRIAEVLEARRAPAGRLAQHYEWAGEPLKAAAAYLEGAREADSLQNPASARELFERSFNLTVDLPPDPARDRLLTDTVWALARIDCAVGRVDETLSRIDACEAGLGEVDDRTRAVLASARARVHYTRGFFAEAVASSRECLAIEAADLDDIQLAPANILGRTQMVSGNFKAAIPLLKRGCELAEEAGAFDEVAHSSAMLGLTLAFVGRYNEAELTLARAASLADRLGDPVRIIAALFY